MAETLFLLQKPKNMDDHTQHVNGVQMAILNADSAQSLSANNATVTAAMNAAEGGTPYPDDYFTSQLDIGDLVTGGMADAGDIVYVTDQEIKKIGVA